MEEKTEYRIMPISSMGDIDVFLQFRCKKNGFFGGKSDSWCLVPREQYAYVIGKHLTKEDCPTSIPFMGKWNFLHTFYQCEGLDLIPFTKNYPDIEKYFERIRKLREDYLQKKNEERNAKPVYL